MNGSKERIFLKSSGGSSSGSILRRSDLLIFVSLPLAQSSEVLIVFPLPLPLPLLPLLPLPLLPLLLGREAPSADDLLGTVSVLSSGLSVILLTWIVLHLILTFLSYQRLLFLRVVIVTDDRDDRVGLLDYPSI